MPLPPAGSTTWPVGPCTVVCRASVVEPRLPRLSCHVAVPDVFITMSTAPTLHTIVLDVAT